jgi:FkbM family methyltransferase
MNFKRFLRKLYSGLQIVQTKVQPSWAQAGEDLIIKYLLHCLDIKKPTYLDIGTNHPIVGNNTYYFYLYKGFKGVCIEPNVAFEVPIRKHRKRDILLVAGVGTGTQREGDFYAFPKKYSSWNTFSLEDAEARKLETNIPYTVVPKLPLVNINDVMAKYFVSHPNIISLDVEGHDLAILKSIDFKKHKPEIICVESITFSANNKGYKVNDISDFMTSMGYFVFADTRINSIFCRNDAFEEAQKTAHILMH